MESSRKYSRSCNSARVRRTHTVFYVVLFGACAVSVVSSGVPQAFSSLGPEATITTTANTMGDLY